MNVCINTHKKSVGVKQIEAPSLSPSFLPHLIPSFSGSQTFQNSQFNFPISPNQRSRNPSGLFMETESGTLKPQLSRAIRLQKVEIEIKNSP